jgi:methyl-accepting chemotaxis protein
VTYYPATTINKALGLEPHADLEMALTVIAQLLASVEDCAALKAADVEAKANGARFRASLLLPETADVDDMVETATRLRAEAREAKKAAADARDAADRFRAELKQANEALGDVQRERDNLKATLADMARLRLRIEADVRATEQARDAAFVALHHATAAYL